LNAQEDPPVSEQTCVARMGLMSEQTKTIVRSIRVSAATATFILGVIGLIDIAVRVWRP